MIISAIVQNVNNTSDYIDTLSNMIESTLQVYSRETNSGLNYKMCFLIILSKRVTEIQQREIIKSTQNAFKKVHFNSECCVKLECPALFMEIGVNDLSIGIDQSVKHRYQYIEKLGNITDADDYCFPINVFVNFNKDEGYVKNLQLLNGNVLLYNI